MKNAFKKVFGIHIKHRSQGSKGTGGVIQGRKITTRIKRNKNKKLPTLIEEKGSFKLVEVIRIKMTQKPEVIEHWIDTILSEGKGLTKWEFDFVESISDQFEAKYWISDKQEEILERIYAEKTPT